MTDVGAVTRGSLDIVTTKKDYTTLRHKRMREWVLIHATDKQHNELNLTRGYKLLT